MLEIHPDKIFALGIIDGPFAMVWGLIAGRQLIVAELTSDHMFATTRP